MKLADRPTPETDRNTWDADLRNMVVDADIAKSLEQRLAHSIAALELVLVDDNLIPRATSECRAAIRKALSEIEEGK